MAGEILLRAIKRNAPLKGGALINMILSGNDIVKYGDTLLGKDGEYIGKMTNERYLGLTFDTFIALVREDYHVYAVYRGIDLDAIVAGLEAIERSIWED